MREMYVRKLGKWETHVEQSERQGRGELLCKPARGIRLTRKGRAYCAWMRWNRYLQSLEAGHNEVLGNE